jgi:pseudouridine synthase
MKLRLNKFIAQAGVCSRRRADEFINAGKVFVNGERAKPGMQIDVNVDKVAINKKTVTLKNEENVYIMVNKPIGYITSTVSDQGKSVLELLKAKNYFGHNGKRERERVFPVGRLDKDSEGLVLLTNDGDLAEKLTHPRFEHEKEYEILVDKQVSQSDIKSLSRQMSLGREQIKGAKIIGVTKTQNGFVVSIILKEGKNRQIRRMFGRLGHNVQNLKRVRINKLKLGKLPTGIWKYIEKNDII